jgi:hypothetical protein
MSFFSRCCHSDLLSGALKLGSKLSLDFPHPKDVERLIRLHRLYTSALTFGPLSDHVPILIPRQRECADFGGDYLKLFGDNIP